MRLVGIAGYLLDYECEVCDVPEKKAMACRKTLMRMIDVVRVYIVHRQHKNRHNIIQHISTP